MFDPSREEGLRRALTEAGRSDAVIALVDDLSFGPIDAPDIGARASWVEDTLGFSGWKALEPEINEFWSKSLDAQMKRVAWVSRWSARQLCGFFEWLRLNGDAHSDVVDLADVWAPGDHDLAAMTPILTAEPLALYPAAGVPEWEFAGPLSPRARDHCLARWSDLKRDNAPLRVMTMQGLQSRGLGVLDDKLLSYVGAEWERLERPLGYFLAEHCWSADGGFWEINEVVAVSRIAALTRAGLIEIRGEPFDVLHCWVRRASGAN